MFMYFFRSLVTPSGFWFLGGLFRGFAALHPCLWSLHPFGVFGFRFSLSVFRFPLIYQVIGSWSVLYSSPFSGRAQLLILLWMLSIWALVIAMPSSSMNRFFQ